MIVLAVVLTLLGLVLPHLLPLTRTAPATAAAFWAVSLALRALLAIFVALYLAFFVPATKPFAELTHWCLHAVLPLLTAHLGLEGDTVGDAATLLPGLLVTASLFSVAAGVVRAARAVRRLLARYTLGPGPRGSIIVSGAEVMLAAAGLARPQVLVSTGALLELDDEELAAGLDHEKGHIARRHRFLLVFAELCRGLGRFVPGSARAMRELTFHLERDADHWALRRKHDRLALATAICKSARTSALSSLAATRLSGSGTKERLAQLLEAQAVPPSRFRAATLNALAAAMIALTILTAALVPSTALAGAQRFSGAEEFRHCEHGLNSHHH